MAPSHSTVLSAKRPIHNDFPGPAATDETSRFQPAGPRRTRSGPVNPKSWMPVAVDCRPDAMSMRCRPTWADSPFTWRCQSIGASSASITLPAESSGLPAG